MSPHQSDTDPNSWWGEHLFYVHPTGSAVTVRADGQAAPFANITQSGWYTFLITWQKTAEEDPALSKMLVLDAQKQLVGSYVTPNTFNGQLLSKDLKGWRSIWITGWPDGWNNDVLAIDNVQVALLPYLD